MGRSMISLLYEAMRNIAHFGVEYPQLFLWDSYTTTLLSGMKSKKQ